MIKIEFDKSQHRKVRKALADLKVFVSYSANETVPALLAKRYITLVREFILTQRFGYEMYNRRYGMWKKSVGMWNKGYWQLTGDLINALTVARKKQGVYFGGVLSGVMDKGGKSWFGKLDKGKPKMIAAYGWIVELGGPFYRGGPEEHRRSIFENTLDVVVEDQTQFDLIIKSTLNRMRYIWK